VRHGEAIMPGNSRSPHPKRWNERHRVVLVEPLSARIVRLRIARGYSVYELATAAGVFAGTIKCLESGKSADKRVLPALASALAVPVCRLVCGEHNSAERACVRPDLNAGSPSRRTRASPSS
jgi:transcriptional regulator with XRE-family HTH domain